MTTSMRAVLDLVSCELMKNTKANRIRVADPLIPMFAETLDGRGNLSLVKRKVLGFVQQESWRLTFVKDPFFLQVGIAIVVPCRTENPHGIVQLLDAGIVKQSQCVFDAGHVYEWAVLYSEVEWDAAANKFRSREGTQWGGRCTTSKAEAKRVYRELRKKYFGFVARLTAQSSPQKLQPFNEHQCALLAAFREVYPETVKALKNWDWALRKGSDTASPMKIAVQKYLIECDRYTKKPTTHAQWWMITHWFDKQLDKMPAKQLAVELTSATKHLFKPNTAHKLRERMNLATHLNPGPPPPYTPLA